MAYTLDIPGLGEAFELDAGQTLFVLGANGTGKSALLQRLMQVVGPENTKKVSATRQTWFQQSGLAFAPSQKGSYEHQRQSWDVRPQSRFSEQNSEARTSLAIYDLIDAENVDARQIAAALRKGDAALAARLAKDAAPIEQINELFAVSNIPIKISIESGDQLNAAKRGSEPYPASELSDGERNALLIGAEILTAKAGTLLIVDEPERHLHRSITSPLLSRLFKFRSDCAFVVASHDLMLPIDNPEARTLLIRSCTYEGRNNIVSWDADLLPSNADVDDELKREIVGARRRIMFVEGDESSLDKPIYSILFPDVSVRAKGSAREVQQAVEGIRATASLHWVAPFGVIDKDGRQPSEVQALEEVSIYPLEFYSVESIYYHPEVIRRVANRQAEVDGGDAEPRANSAIAAAIAAVRPHLDRLSARAVEKTVRSEIFAGLPTLQDIQERRNVLVNVDVDAILTNELQTLTTAADNGDWLSITRQCPIRESSALDAIAREIGLKGRWQYEEAVLQLLRTDEDAIAEVRGYFGRLPTALGVPEEVRADADADGAVESEERIVA